MMIWAISQLLSYSLINWLVFLLIAVSAAYLGRLQGVIVGHVLLALVVLFLDVSYLDAHAEEMDQDILFSMGVMLRILLVNTVLLPISGIMFWLSNRRHKRGSA